MGLLKIVSNVCALIYSSSWKNWYWNFQNASQRSASCLSQLRHQSDISFKKWMLFIWRWPLLRQTIHHRHQQRNYVHWMVSIWLVTEDVGISLCMCHKILAMDICKWDGYRQHSVLSLTVKPKDNHMSACTAHKRATNCNEACKCVSPKTANWQAALSLQLKMMRQKTNVKTFNSSLSWGDPSSLVGRRAC